ncbi:WD repeat-containing protein 91 isoform X1 [Astyanax mexicanus]|uniref:WD repeat-containing protein 91 isoform X1 n=2 Tax=Astyanax mexicanus TaxID=7994 RepID=UPI0020CAA87C|nr:WD repeat-containing protein 91 isoform X1 [Astyanax mexicanus]
MASAVERTDDLVREYLIYRGFTSALKHLDSEIKSDKEKGFRVDKIIDQLQHFIQTYDLAGLKEYWGYLDRRLFSRLEDVYRPTVNKLRTSLFRYYLVHTIQMKNQEKTQEFFQKQAAELQGQAEWRDWFVLPFIPVPEQNPAFSPYFSRQWADTFLVSLHNFLSVLFQCMPQPVLLSFDAEVQRSTSIQEESEQLRQMLFALQGESKAKKAEEMVHHKLPAYVQHMDRLGDTELDLVTSQRATNPITPSRNFFSTFLPQGRRTPARTPQGPPGSSPTQAALGRKDPTAGQSVKVKDPIASKDSKLAAAIDPSTGHPRQKRHLDHEKERKELFSKQPAQGSEKKADSSDTEGQPETDTTDSPTNQTRSGSEVGGPGVEQPFIKLSQEEYGEHHSSIMHCRVDCSGRRVASLDVDGVVKVWSFNPIMQTKATIMSKSPLLSLEWATKPDRLLLLGSGVGTVRLYDTEAKKNLYEMTIDDAHPRILSLAYSPSGTSFVCSAAANVSRPGSVTEMMPRASLPVSGQLLLWDTKTVKQQLQFALEPGPVAVNCTAFNHNGNLLVTGAADGWIRLFDMQRYESVMSWKAHDGEVYSVEFSYDENAVFSIGEDGKFIQWNIHRSGVKQSEYSLSQDAVGPFVLSGYSGYKQVQVPRGRLFAFDSEGQHVLTCSSTGGLIYRLNKGEAGLESVLSLGGHKAPVVTVDWCSAVDCGTCLTASMDGKIKLSTLLAQKP